MNIEKIIRIHEMISSKQTGKPKEFALKLGLSERMIYHYLSYMKDELKAPISYDAALGCYYYETECALNFRGKK